MKPKTLLVLTLLVAALAAFVWFVERDLPSSDELAEKANRVLPVEPGDVAAVAIDWDGRKVRLERPAAAKQAAEDEGGAQAGNERGEDGEDGVKTPATEWRLTAPTAARADRAVVDTLLAALTGLRKSRTLDDVDPAAVGLDAPRGSVTLTTADDDSRLLRLLIGAAVPGSDDVIVALEGRDDAWVTSASFLSQLDQEPAEWRSRDVVAVAREDVTGIRLEAAGGEAPVVLAREGGRFRLESPIEDLASDDLVDRLLADLATLRAQSFLDDDPRSDAELGLAPPRATLVAHLAHGGSVRVEIGAPVAGGGEPPSPSMDDASEEAPSAVYARVGDQRFEAVTGLAGAVARPARAWRSRSWTGLRSFEVDRIEVEETGMPGTLVLSRDGVDWRRGDETIPYTAASDLLFALTEAEGSPAEVSESGAPVLTVRLKGGDGADQGDETLTLYPSVAGSGDGHDGNVGPGGDGGSAHPARSSARASVLLLPDDAVKEVRDALAKVRTAEPETPEDGRADS